MTSGRQRKNVEFTTVQEESKEEKRAVSWLCGMLGVSRSGYYKWQHHVKTREELENEEIAEQVKKLHEEHKQRLGYRRMTGYLNRDNGTEYGEKRIYGIMRRRGIHSVIRRKRKTYQRSTAEVTAENVLNRDFNASRPNEKWLTDVTEFRWYDGCRIRKLYLSGILDLYDKSIVSYEIREKNNNELVCATLDRAIAANPDAKPILHSDRGFQYTTQVFRNKLLKQGMTPSMSRTGHCIDNGPMEGFWSTIKAEMYDLREYRSVEELTAAIEEYIRYYHEKRYQARFGYRTPNEVRAEALGQAEPAQYPIAPNPRIRKFKARYHA